MLRIINLLFILFFGFSSFAQTTQNPAITNIQINTDYAPATIEPTVSREADNHQAQQLKTYLGNSELNAKNAEIIQNADPFNYAKRRQINQQNNNSQPYDNYEFTKNALENPKEKTEKKPQDKVDFIFDSNLTNENSEIYRKSNNPNQLTPNSINQPIPLYKERKEICDDTKTVCIIYFISDLTISVEVQNNSVSTRTVSLLIWNKNSEVALKIQDPDKIIVRGKERVKIAEIKRVSTNEDFSFNFNFTSIDGFVDAIHNDNYVYNLPFEVGKTYKMVQGYGGSFSHDDEENYFSYDFRMATGTPVYAAREGTIIRIKEDYSKGGLNPAFRQRANFIHVEHDDGTIGVYGHLMQGGTIVKIGDYVQKGQKIGYSGNTGYTGSPHLHFAVVKVKRSGKLQSVQIKMRTPNGVEERLKDNTYYSR